jgi:hypothetical protein
MLSAIYLQNLNLKLHMCLEKQKKTNYLKRYIEPNGIVSGGKLNQEML